MLTHLDKKFIFASYSGIFRQIATQDIQRRPDGVVLTDPTVEYRLPAVLV
jgi:hypothetical protein